MGQPLADVLLLDFFRRVFEPHRLNDRGERQRQTYVEAIAWLERLLKRKPRLKDITPENLEKLQRRICRHGFSRTRARHIKTRLSSLAKHAWRLGWIEGWEAIPDVVRKRRRPRLPFGPAGPGTLEAEALAAMDARNAARYRTTVRRFSRFLGRHATVDDVADTDAMGRFRDELLLAGNQNAAAVVHLSNLRRLGRLVAPERFPDTRHKLATLPPAEPGTARHFFETEYRPSRLVGAQRVSIIGHRYTFRMLREQHGRDVLLSELNDSLAADFFAWLLETRGIRPVTVNRHRAHLFAVWRLAVERGLVEREPRVRKLREHRDEPDAWTADELRRIFDAPARMAWATPEVEGIAKGPYLQALLLVAYWTGLRRRSLFAIRRANVNLETGWLNVPGDAMKSGRGKQFRLGADAIAAIKLIWLPERELLFPWPWDKSCFAAHMRKILREAGVAESTRRCGTQLHKMRRTTATFAAIQRGLAAASELLGHSTTEITKRYVDPSKLPGTDATEFLPQVTAQPAAADWLAALPASPPPPAVPAEGSTATEGETPAPQQLLEEARALFAMGHVRAAAMTGRVALERILTEAARRRRCTAGSLGQTARALYRAGAIDAHTANRIGELAKIGNRAAHGEPLTSAQVLRLLSETASLCHWALHVDSAA